MKKPYLFMSSLLILMVILCGGGYLLIHIYKGPEKTMLNIASAVTEKNPGKLNKFIDFPTLRENIKGQLRTEIAQEAENELEMAGMMMGMGLADGFIDQVLTAEGVIGIIHMDGFSDGVGGDFDEIKENIKKDTKVELLNLSEAEITITNEEFFGEEYIEINLERRGLTWVVIDAKISGGM